MDLNAVRMLVKVAELKSFTQAAHSLGTTQSRISRAIAQLEAELGHACCTAIRAMCR